MIGKLSGRCAPAAMTLMAATHAGPALPDAEVRVELRGAIPVSCVIQRQGAEQATVDLSASGERSFVFDIDCNAPMTVTLSASNGALQNPLPIAHSAQFVRSVTYSAAFLVDLPVAGAGTVVVPETAGATLVGGVAHATAEPPYETTGALRVRWTRDSRRLVAGTYAETLTVLVNGQI